MRAEIICGTFLAFENRDQELLCKLERATGIEPVLPTWESKFSFVYFQYLQNRSRKINVHALHTVHALSDLRIAGGRFGDVFTDDRAEEFSIS